MSNSQHSRRRNQPTLLVGWLFADLLLALAVLFLIANTTGVAAKPKPPPTPTPIVTRAPTPTPTPSGLLLDPQRVRLTLTTNNPAGLSQGDPQAMQDLATEIRAQMTRLGLQRRQAGLAIAYGGAPDPSGIHRAQQIAATVYTVLANLGHQRFVFCHTLPYDELYVLQNDPTTIAIDIYMFVPSVGGC